MDRFYKSKLFIIMIIICVFLLGVMLFFYSGRGNTPFFENIIGTFVTPIQKAFSRITETGGNVFKSYTQYEDLQKENQKLKEELAKSLGVVRQAQKSISENEDLKKMMGIKTANPDFEFCLGEVISQEPTKWFSSFTIDKGSLDGIKKGDAVMTSDGLVGYVTETGYNYSKISSVIDTNFVVGGIVSRTREVGVCEGEYKLMDDGKLKLSYAGKDADFVIGDTVETSGITTNLPKGIGIGRIVDIKMEAHGLSQYAIIEPFSDLRDLKNVFVIINFGEKETTKE